SVPRHSDRVPAGRSGIAVQGDGCELAEGRELRKGRQRYDLLDGWRLPAAAYVPHLGGREVLVVSHSCYTKAPASRPGLFFGEICRGCLPLFRPMRSRLAAAMLLVLSIAACSRRGEQQLPA